jgi:hypothetical protein
MERRHLAGSGPAEKPALRFYSFVVVSPHRFKVWTVSSQQPGEITKVLQRIACIMPVLKLL